MKIKLDENLPASLGAALNILGHDVDTTPSEGLAGSNDDSIWEASRTAERFLITQDLDFSDLRRFLPGTHHGILLVRMKAPGALALLERVRSIFTTQDVAGWEGCFVVATERKLRIRRPPML